MDLRAIANAVTVVVNPNELVTVQRSTGYSIGPGAKQVPAYAVGVTGPAQIQALDNSDLKQIENLNIQGDLRSIYLRGTLQGVIRPDAKGGDLVTRDDGSTWLVTKVLETWPLWTKAVIVKQSPA